MGWTAGIAAALALCVLTLGPRVASAQVVMPGSTMVSAPADGPGDPDSVRAHNAALGRRRFWGMLLAGTGAALIGGGVYFAMKAGDKADEVSDASRWSDDLASVESDGQSADTMAWVLLGTGSVALAGGVFLYVTGRKSLEAPMPTVTGFVAPGAIGAMFAQRW